MTFTLGLDRLVSSGCASRRAAKIFVGHLARGAIVTPLEPLSGVLATDERVRALSVWIARPGSCAIMRYHEIALMELVQIPFSGEGVSSGGWRRLSMKKLFLAAVAFILLAAHVQAAERRIALVVGNANYQTGALPTPANDAGLVAQTLQAAGFDVTGARDLDQDSLRHAFRDFIDKASASGPDAVAFVYLS
jgi:Caspase domain